MKRLSFDNFVKRSIVIHGVKYVYSHVSIINVHTKVPIVCPIHGIFEQTPNKHMAGRGCPECAVYNRSNKRRSTKEDFINKANIIHDFKYNYDDVIYVNTQTKVKIKCPAHGFFEQTPGNHTHSISPTGCPSCSLKGLNFSEPCVLYILVNDIDLPELIKIGITNNFRQRFKKLKRKTPFKIEKLNEFHFQNGRTAYNLEQNIHNNFKHLNAGLTGFEGCTEWFYYSPKILDYIKIILDGLQFVGLKSTYEKKT